MRMDYLKLTEVYDALDKTTKRLEKTDIISKFLRAASKEDIPYIIPLLMGKIFIHGDVKHIGVSSRLVLKTLAYSTGINQENIEKEWSKIGDLGEVAYNLIKIKKQTTLGSSHLTIKKVLTNIQQLADLVGEGTVSKKVSLMSELLTSATPIEAKYIARTILEDLRVGTGEGTLRDAIVWAFLYKNIKYDLKENKILIDNREEYNNYTEEVQHAYNLSSDFADIIIKLKEKGGKSLKSLSLKSGSPIKVMLYPKAKDLEDAFEQVGKPCAFEYKYDGFRMLLHRDGDKFWLFTRRLDDVTKQFPDVVEIIKKNIRSNNYILDSEVIGIDPKTKKWLPFQDISQRIKRKYDIQKLVKDTPVMINVFDAIQIDGRNLINIPFKERRVSFKKIIKEVPEKLQLAEQLVTDDLKKAEKFYEEALKKGNEGIMAKSLEGIYKPGSRVGYGVKVKPILENLDLVITGAQWGEGKRATWLSSFTLSCKDKDKFLEIGKVGTGIKEKEEGVSFKQLTDLLKPLVIISHGKTVEVKPKIIIEIGYQEIQKSPTYNSGFALRFPRVIQLRNDKPLGEISDLDYIKRIYTQQKHKHK